MCRMSEVEHVEHQTEDSLYFLRSDENKSPYNVDKHKKVVRNNLAWLRDNAPDSYLLEQDNSDVIEDQITMRIKWSHKEVYEGT